MQLDEIIPTQIVRNQLADYSRRKVDAFGAARRDPEVSSYLIKYGFNLIGTGQHARVYSNPNYPYVLKVFNAYDHGYITWYKWCQTHQYNPWVPQIKGGIIKISATVYAVRLEKLEPCRTNAYVAIGSLIISVASDGNPWNFPNGNPLVSKEIPGWYKDPYLKEVVEFLANHEKNPSRLSGSVDIHGGNFMIRPSDKHLVCVDPLGT